MIMTWNISRRKFLISSTGIATLATIAPSELLAIKKRKSVRFGVLTDSHYADREPSGTRYYRQSLEKMEEAINVLNQEKVDFAIHLGDFKDEHPTRVESDTIKFLQDIESEYSQFNGPRYHCIGNHDLDSISKEQFQTNVTNTGIDSSETYFSFDHNGFHFIVLDPNFHPDGRPHHKGDYEWFEANLPESQWEWFEDDLAKTKLPTIVFSHFTLYHFVKGDAVFHMNEYVRAQKIMEDSGKVIATFHGHVHEENYTAINGIHYCTHLGMVDYDGLENNSFAIVEVNEREINITGYKRTSNKTLKKGHLKSNY